LAKTLFLLWFGFYFGKVELYTVEFLKAFIGGLRSHFCGSVYAMSKDKGRWEGSLTRELLPKHVHSLNDTVLYRRPAGYKSVNNVT